MYDVYYSNEAVAVVWTFRLFIGRSSSAHELFYTLEYCWIDT